MGCEHKWMVCSTAISERALIVECSECEATGTVNDPNAPEWAAAFYAPLRSYAWHDPARVVIDPEGLDQ